MGKASKDIISEMIHSYDDIDHVAEARKSEKKKSQRSTSLSSKEGELEKGPIKSHHSHKGILKKEKATADAKIDKTTLNQIHAQNDNRFYDKHPARSIINEFSSSRDFNDQKEDFRNQRYAQSETWTKSTSSAAVIKLLAEKTGSKTSLNNVSKAKARFSARLEKEKKRKRTVTI